MLVDTRGLLVLFRPSTATALVSECTQSGVLILALVMADLIDVRRNEGVMAEKILLIDQVEFL